MSIADQIKATRGLYKNKAFIKSYTVLTELLLATRAMRPPLAPFLSHISLAAVPFDMSFMLALVFACIRLSSSSSSSLFSFKNNFSIILMVMSGNWSNQIRRQHLPSKVPTMLTDLRLKSHSCNVYRMVGQWLWLSW